MIVARNTIQRRSGGYPAQNHCFHIAQHGVSQRFAQFAGVENEATSTVPNDGGLSDDEPTVTNTGNTKQLTSGQHMEDERESESKTGRRSESRGDDDGKRRRKKNGGKKSRRRGREISG